MLERLGRSCARHHWRVLALWAVVLVGCWVVGATFGRAPNNTFSLPGAQSEEALDLLEADFPVAADASATILYHTSGDTKVTDSSVESAVKDAVGEFTKLEDVRDVTDPFDNPSANVSEDEQTAKSTVFYDEPIQDLTDNGAEAFDALERVQEQEESSALEIELGGSLPGAQATPLSDALVFIGLVAALVVLLVALGTWWSFAWPVAGALIGVALGHSLTQLLQRFVDVPSISSTAAVMIGLGVGIDYGLFVVGRFKEAIARGASPEDAGGEAVPTAGRAVLTAGSTVVVALVALLVFQIPAVNAIAYAVVIVVVSVVAVAITLQPAVLGLIGRRLTRGRLPWERHGDDAEQRMGMRWAGFVTRHARLAFTVGTLVLVVLAIPVFAGSLRLGPIDNSLFAPDTTQYRAWKLQTEAFGPGSTDPFLVVVEVPSGAGDVPSQVDDLADAVGKTSGVESVTPAIPNSDQSVWVFELEPTTGAQDEATEKLVRTLRDDTIPEATEGTDLTALVSGSNAVFVDLDERIGDRLVLFIGLVLVIAFVILGFVFRSLPIPAKAAVFNVLTILATYGVFVAFFTYGWGRSLIDVPQNVPMLSLLAPVVFGVLFGLSNDYEVYLMTRMHEEFLEDGDARRAARVGHGLGSRVVIAAALVMIFVFFSYVFQPGTTVKEFGFAMGIAIVIDAFITRMIMLPSFMALGGRAMWFPGSRHVRSGVTNRQ